MCKFNYDQQLIPKRVNPHQNCRCFFFFWCQPLSESRTFQWEFHLEPHVHLCLIMETSHFCTSSNLILILVCWNFFFFSMEPVKSCHWAWVGSALQLNWLNFSDNWWEKCLKLDLQMQLTFITAPSWRFNILEDFLQSISKIRNNIWVILCSNESHMLSFKTKTKPEILLCDVKMLSQFCEADFFNVGNVHSMSQSFFLCEHHLANWKKDHETQLNERRVIHLVNYSKLA